MAAPEDADEAEVVQRNATGELRGAPGLVGAVAVVHRPAWTSHRRENLPQKKTNKKTNTKDTSQFEFQIFKTLPPILFSSFLLFLVTWTMDVVKNATTETRKQEPQSRPFASIKQTETGGPSTTQSDHLRTFAPYFSTFFFSRSEKHYEWTQRHGQKRKAAVAGRLKDQTAAIWT